MLATLILSTQLYPEPIESGEIALWEARRFFTDFDFHVQKLVLHRASMKAYQQEHEIETYIEFDDDINQFFQKHDEIRMYRPEDRKIAERLRQLAGENDTELVFKESPGFIASREWNRKYFSEHEYFQLAYYKKMRKKHDILVKGGKPVGEKWSFDQDNRKKMPGDVELPEIPSFSNKHVEEAKEYVKQNFGDNPGDIEGFRWPTTRKEALENLEDFLENRLENFGDYQDAFDKDLEHGFHSLLSPSLNTGLITPGEVLEKTLEKHEDKNYPMNSLEGFIRQVLGWREYMRALYQLEGEQIRQNNYWDMDGEMPTEFYTASTGTEPVDDAIKHAKQNAYCHHIERLMVLGNFMLLSRIDPDEVYRWFMELFIDSYDWVMVPNVYAMSQYADPGYMTKPYISSSNYIRKMSHYSGDWEETWDALYWNFIDDYSHKIAENNRMAVMVSNLDRMGEEKVEGYREKAESFRQQLSN